MAGPTDPVLGDMHIDARGIDTAAVPAEDLPGMLKLRDGAEEAMEALERLTPEQIAQIGIHPDDIARLRAHIAARRKVAAFLAAARRMTDKLEQTRYHHGHEIAALFGEIAAQATRRARSSSHRREILDAFGPILDYRSGPARKGWRTRARNQRATARAATAAPPEPAAIAPEPAPAIAPSPSLPSTARADGQEGSEPHQGGGDHQQDGVEHQQSRNGVAPLVHVRRPAVIGRPAAVGLVQRVVIHPRSRGDQHEGQEPQEHRADHPPGDDPLPPRLPRGRTEGRPDHGLAEAAG